jgi:hypothetical protein
MNERGKIERQIVAGVEKMQRDLGIQQQPETRERSHSGFEGHVADGFAPNVKAAPTALLNTAPSPAHLEGSTRLPLRSERRNDGIAALSSQKTWAMLGAEIVLVACVFAAFSVVA